VRINRTLSLLLVVASAATHAWTQTSGVDQTRYHLVKKIVLGGDGGWDYFTTDPATHRIFIGRGSYVMVLDPDGTVVGEVDVGKDNEAQAVALEPDLHLAFTSNGGGSSVSVFDPRTLKVMRVVKTTGRDTDDIMYEPFTKRVFTFNGGKGNDATAIDPLKGVVVGQVPLGGKPETGKPTGMVISS